MIKLALIDDHIILRKSLAVLIGMLGDFTIVQEANNGRHFIEQLKKKELPDIALIDINMPVMDGVETARWLRQNHPRVKVLALSMVRNDLVIMRMLRNGARGYLLKDSDPAILKTALLDVQEKGYYYNDLVTPLMRSREVESGRTPQVMLNEQELVFLRWACTELSHKQIAAEMQVSPRTVDGYRDSLFRKLNVASRVGMAIYAIRAGIVQV
ncbi:MAG: DNA-binding response regulator [Sediminibacterium sp.]|nr:DNA-binding response regulator [Sediminibacterium sp.]